MSSDINVRTISWLEGMLDTTVTAYEDHRNALQCVRDEIVQQCGAEGGKCFHLNSQRTAEILQGIDDVLSQSELQLCGMEDWENINGGGAAVAAARRQRLEDAPPLSQEVDLRQRQQQQQQQQQRQREQTSVNTRSGTNREQGPSAATGAQEPAMQRSNNSGANNVEENWKRTMTNGDATAPDGSLKSPSMEPRGTHSANGMKNDEQEGERQQRQRQRQQQPAARDQEDRQSAHPHTESLNSSRPFPTTPALQQTATPPPPPPPQGQQFDPRATSTTGGASSSSRYQPVHTTQSDPRSTPPPSCLRHEGPGDTVKVKEPGNNAAVGSSSSSSSSDIRNKRNDRSRVECVRGGDYEQYPPNEGDTPYEPVPSETSSLPRRRITRSNNNSNSAEAATSCGNRPCSQRRSRVCGKTDVDNDEDGGDSSVHTTDKRLPRSSRSSRYSGSNHGGGEMPKDSLQRKPVAVQKQQQQQQNDRDGIREDQAAGSKTTTPPSSSVPRSTLKSITKRESVPLQPWPLPENKDPRLTGSRVSESRISNNKSKDAAANPITTNSTNTSYNTMNETPQRPPAQNATPPPTSQARPHNNIRNSDGINRGDINNNNKSGSSRTRSSERASAAPVRKAYSPSPYHPYNAAVATAASALASVPRQHSADKSVDVKSPPSPAAAAGAHPSGSRASSTSVPSTPPPPPSVLQQQHQNCERGDGMVVTPSVSMLPQHRQTSAEALADGASAEGGSENHSTPVQEAQLAIPKGPGAVRPLRTAIPKRTTTSINDSKQIEIAMYGAPLLRQPGAPPKGGVLEDAPEVDEFLKMEQDRLEEKREREEEECRRHIKEAERVAARRKGRSASILAMDSPGTLVMIKDRETGGVIMTKAERPKPTAAELQLRQERDILHTQLERMQLEYANVIARRRDTGGEPRYAQLHHRITRVQKDLQRLNVETAQVMKLEKESGQYREPAPKRLM